MPIAAAHLAGAVPELDLLDAYTSWMRAAGFGERTMTSRLEFVRRLADGAGGDPAAVTAPQVLSLIGSVPSAWSRATYYGHAASWARFLATMDLGGEWLAKLPKPRPARSTPRPLTDQQLAAALAVAPPRARTMILLGAYQGLRVSEIARVAGRDVTERTLRVRGKGGASKTLPTHPLVWQEAARYPAGYWFQLDYRYCCDPVPVDGVDRPSNRHAVWGAITRAFATAGFTATPHQLRHWYATTLLRSGANIRVVQELMRHASLATTQVYTKVDDDDCTAAVVLLPDLTV